MDKIWLLARFRRSKEVDEQVGFSFVLDEKDVQVELSEEQRTN